MLKSNKGWEIQMQGFDDMLEFLPDPGPDYLITNFDRDDECMYAKAIAQYNALETPATKVNLYIHENAYNCMGRRINGYLSLRATSDGPVSEFWDIYNAIKRDGSQ